MSANEVAERPPTTLIGLGPPEPPQKYGADPKDAPETVRNWSNSDSFAAASHRRRMPALALTAAVVAVAAGVTLVATTKHRAPPRATAAAPAHPSTTRVVGGPWVLRDDPAASEELSPDATEPHVVPFRLPRKRHGHAGVVVAPRVETERTTLPVTTNEARIQSIAESVELEDEGPAAETSEAAETPALPADPP